MPPVSVTMHPVKLPVVDPLAVLDAAAELDELAELDAGLLVLLAVDELLPHAAISSAVAAAATVAANEVCFIRFLHWTRCRRPGTGKAFPCTDCPEIISLAYQAVGGGAYCDHLVAKSRPDCLLACGLAGQSATGRALGR
jgi:hypothetical protein